MATGTPTRYPRSASFPATLGQVAIFARTFEKSAEEAHVVSQDTYKHEGRGGRTSHQRYTRGAELVCSNIVHVGVGVHGEGQVVEQKRKRRLIDDEGEEDVLVRQPRIDQSLEQRLEAFVGLEEGEEGKMSTAYRRHTARA
jgi:hypothetical protein